MEEKDSFSSRIQRWYYLTGNSSASPYEQCDSSVAPVTPGDGDMTVNLLHFFLNKKNCEIEEIFYLRSFFLPVLAVLDEEKLIKVIRRSLLHRGTVDGNTVT